MIPFGKGRSEDLDCRIYREEVLSSLTQYLGRLGQHLLLLFFLFLSADLFSGARSLGWLLLSLLFAKGLLDHVSLAGRIHPNIGVFLHIFRDAFYSHPFLRVWTFKSSSPSMAGSSCMFPRKFIFCLLKYVFI